MGAVQHPTPAELQRAGEPSRVLLFDAMILMQMVQPMQQSSRKTFPCCMQDAQGFWGCSNFKSECDYRESVPARHLSPQLAFEIMSPTTFQARLCFVCGLQEPVSNALHCS